MAQPQIVTLTPEGDPCNGGFHRAVIENFPPGVSATWNISSFPAGVAASAMQVSPDTSEVSFQMPLSVDDQPVLIRAKLQ